jgi:hypothetical protein
MADNEKPKLRGLQFRQEQANEYLRAYLKTNPQPENHGDWRWKDYGVDLQRTTVVVLGENVVGDKIQIVYLLTFQSKCAIPHFGQIARAKAKENDDSTCTFFQLSNSYGPNDTTPVMNTYVGSEPPVPVHPPPST